MKIGVGLPLRSHERIILHPYDKRVEVEEHLPEQKVLKDKSAVTIDSHNSLGLRVSSEAKTDKLPNWNQRKRQVLCKKSYLPSQLQVGIKRFVSSLR
uniref:Uncharacterized protein n=1 Tax=Daphnia galeata TaxID=27404 RepID=A0A8J2WNX4_9CRUS|nr:unnamed protein product [Daphnia galeata]